MQQPTTTTKTARPRKGYAVRMGFKALDVTPPMLRRKGGRRVLLLTPAAYARTVQARADEVFAY